MNMKELPDHPLAPMIKLGLRPQETKKERKKGRKIIQKSTLPSDWILYGRLTHEMLLYLCLP